MARSEDVRDRLVALLDLLYVHAAKKLPTTDVGGNTTTRRTRHVPEVPSEVKVRGYAFSRNLVSRDQTTFDIDGRRFVVFEKHDAKMYVELRDPSKGVKGVVVLDNRGLSAFESTAVEVTFKPTSYENLSYQVLDAALRDHVDTYLPKLTAYDEVAYTDVSKLMVARKEKGSAEYTHFVDSRDPVEPPEWVKVMRHATQFSKGVLTLSLTPFETTRDGLVTAILKKDENEIQAEGYERHLLMDDAIWNEVDYLVYPIPRAIGSLDSLGIEEIPIPDDPMHAIRIDLAEGEYLVQESLQGNDRVADWSREIDDLYDFAVMGYLHKGKTPVNVVALRHKTSHVVKKHPTYPMKMKMSQGGISNVPDPDRSFVNFVTHLAVVNALNPIANVVRWNLGRDFLNLVRDTPKLTEEEEKTTKAENIFYQNGGYVIFPLSGDVLRVKEN